MTDSIEQRSCVNAVNTMYNDHSSRIIILEKDMEHVQGKICSVESGLKDHNLLLSEIRDAIISAKSSAATLLKMVTVVVLCATGAYYVTHITNTNVNVIEQKVK